MKIDVPEVKIHDSVKLPASKTCIIVVDMQNDFVNPKGKLFVSSAAKTIPAIKKLLEKARGHNVKVFYTMDTHMKDDIEFKIWGEHTVENTWGWQIVDELKPNENDIIVRKLRYDGFFGTPLDHLLRIHGIENVIIVGTVANICVLHTAGSAALRGYKIIVPVDGISALNEFDYYLSLRQIEFLYRGTLTKVDNITFT